MGTVKNMLAKDEFNFDSYFHDDLRIEVAEGVHLHWRDIRLLLKPKQFETLIISTMIAKDNWRGECEKVDTVLSTNKITEGISLDNTVSLEEQENGCIHFHYKDMRIELQQKAFIKLCSLFKKALSSFLKFREVLIHLDRIDPYDHIHFATRKKWVSIKGYSKKHLINDYNDHISGMNWVVGEMAKGNKIKPILITEIENGKFKRRDGFKRYMAYKMLDYTYIPCYVVEEEVALTCLQDKEYPFLGG